MNPFVVTYRVGHTGNGSQQVRRVKTTAYSASDAGFQAMINPRNHAAANKPWVYVTLLAVAPYSEGDKVDADLDREVHR